MIIFYAGGETIKNFNARTVNPILIQKYVSLRLMKVRILLSIKTKHFWIDMEKILIVHNK
jgi:hypothetical protein